MKKKAQFIFIISIALYIIAISTMPYVFVNITYVAFPVITILGFFSFATFDNSLYKKMFWLFWIILSLWIITIVKVTYVGVYLSWIVVPILIVLGVIWYISKPKRGMIK